VALHEFNRPGVVVSRTRATALDHTAQQRPCSVAVDHPDGICGQVLDRGLLPRFSIGTLQLSIRCSSIHFLPMRSFPVSVGPLAGTAVSAFGAVWSGCLSCAKAADARHTAKIKLIILR
jgi:hypothetical protein